MLLGLWIARNVNQIRGVMVTGSSLLLILAAYLAVSYIGLRNEGATAEMLFTDSVVWYAPLHICYSVGVDGISVVMLLLSSIIVFTGTFASWKLKPLTKEYFLWFTLLSTGVFGFFISTDLFTMFMFYEVALIPMCLIRMNNDVSLITIIKLHIPCELCRFLVESIGIVLAIPISILVTSVMIKVPGMFHRQKKARKVQGEGKC